MAFAVWCFGSVFACLLEWLPFRCTCGVCVTRVVSVCLCGWSRARSFVCVCVVVGGC